MERIRFVCATRGGREDFLGRSLFGRSLPMLNGDAVEIRLFENNREALTVVYNQAIEEAKAQPATLVFVHDDVLVCDVYWREHLNVALNKFDVVGVVGNKRRIAHQPCWVFLDGNLRWDDYANYSGSVAHGAGFPPENVSRYGPVGAQVKLLDGLLLAANSETLHSSGLRFDSRFGFHFYDVDFCREAEARQLQMGTADISVVHGSGGAFGSEAWRQGYLDYLQKWGE